MLLSIFECIIELLIKKYIIMTTILWVIAIGSALIAVLRGLFGFSNRIVFGQEFENKLITLNLSRPQWLEEIISFVENMTLAAVVLLSLVALCHFSREGVTFETVSVGVIGGGLLAALYGIVIWPFFYLVLYFAVLTIYTIFLAILWVVSGVELLWLKIRQKVK